MSSDFGVLGPVSCGILHELELFIHCELGLFAQPAEFDCAAGEVEARETGLSFHPSCQASVSLQDQLVMINRHV